MSQDHRDDKNLPYPSVMPDPEGDATMELSIRDVLNIQSHDKSPISVAAQRPPSGITQSVAAQRVTAAFDAEDDEDDDTNATSVLMPDQRLLAAAAGAPSHDATAEVRLDAALLASIRRTEEIREPDNETSTFSVPSDLLRLAAQHTAETPAPRGPVTVDLPSSAIEPLTLQDEDVLTRPTSRAPIEAIATIDPLGRLVLPSAVLQAARLRPGQRLKIVAYVIE